MTRDKTQSVFAQSHGIVVGHRLDREQIPSRPFQFDQAFECGVRGDAERLVGDRMGEARRESQLGQRVGLSESRTRGEALGRFHAGERGEELFGSCRCRGDQAFERQRSGREAREADAER